MWAPFSQNGIWDFGRGGVQSRRNNVQNFNTGTTGADQATGILHQKSHNIDSPITGTFQFHAGKPDQTANNTLVNKAAANGFKIQNDYFPASRRSSILE